MTTILAIIVLILYVFGAILSTLLTGWEYTTKDIFKIITWPISLFIAKK